MPNLSLGLSALRTSQYALDVVSNNIANANTEGYHRRSVHLEALPSNQNSAFRIGSGVNINYIERIRGQVTESSLTNAIADVSRVEQALIYERQIEAAFLNGGTSVGAELDQFFGEMTKMTAAPDEPSQRSAVIESGRRLAGVVRQAAGQLADLKKAIRFQVEQEVALVNQKMESLTELNANIKSLIAQGYQPNAELDQRDALLNDIAKTIGLTREDSHSGDLNLAIGNFSIEQTGHANQFSVTQLPDGKLGILIDGYDRQVDLESGGLVALLDVYNTTIPKYEGKLNQLATEVMRSVDSIHATGIGTDGSFQHLAATRTLTDAAAPLNDAGTIFPIDAGDLTISVIDVNGVRRTEVVTIDPAVDSLDDVAAKIASIDGLNAAVNPSTNQLQIFSADGLTFDFTGSVETHPRLDALSGSSLPTLSGNYTGDQNRDLRFEIDGTGDVGISDDLFVSVYSQSGTLERRVNIGNGYEAGTSIDLGDGIKISFSRGTVNDADNFSTRLTAQPDETGILAALGLNSFFKGVNSYTMDVDPTISDNPGRFAAGRSGDSADTDNLFRLAALQDISVLPGGLTFSEYVNEINTEIGFQINSDTALSSSLEALKFRLEADRDSYSGVDLNEEIVYLQQFQKSYEAAVRVIQTADDMLNELFNILG
ncbi:MAG: flagellar hook-associated protein FlgK [Pirellulaceae bacterium]|nr:flagellar hook-associated protein FlgK [Pirellulaceae bacterium]